MTTRSRLVRVVLGVAFAASAGVSAQAFQVKEFAKLTPKEQSMFIAGAVNMVSYRHAVDGNQQLSKCVHDWYYKAVPQAGGKVAAVGPSQLAYELHNVQKVDPTIHVEAVIHTLAEEACKPGK